MQRTGRTVEVQGSSGDRSSEACFSFVVAARRASLMANSASPLATLGLSVLVRAKRSENAQMYLCQSIHRVRRVGVFQWAPYFGRFARICNAAVPTIEFSINDCINSYGPSDLSIFSLNI